MTLPEGTAVLRIALAKPEAYMLATLAVYNIRPT